MKFKLFDFLPLKKEKKGKQGKKEVEEELKKHKKNWRKRWGISQLGGIRGGGAAIGVGIKGARNGIARTRKVERKVVTHRETVVFPYYSVRDISGTFVVSCSREKAMGKVYARLQLEEDISFADSYSQSDYEKFKSDFYNRYRDKEMNFNETKEIPGFEKYISLYVLENQNLVE